MKKLIVCQGIILDNQRRILLIKRKYNKKNLPNYWAFPGGNQEIGESKEETVIREVREEVGLDFVITELFMEGDGVSGYYVYRFIGKYSGIIMVQDDECDGYGWFSYAETEHLLIQPLMRDAIQGLSNQKIIL